MAGSCSLIPRKRRKSDRLCPQVKLDNHIPNHFIIHLSFRYTRKGGEGLGSEYRWGQGQCFSLTNSLSWEETWEPCSGRPTTRAHEEWGYCQAGTAAALLPDSTALMGAPGPHTWRGSVFAVSTASDWLFRDKTHYHSPVVGQDSPVPKYSYLGMAVAAGALLPPSRSCGEHLTYAVGAPRANGTGQVILFSKCHSELLKVQLVLPGKEFASQFGYSLTTGDFNSDGMAELCVGAPWAIGGGAVYCYAATKDGLRDDTKALVLHGKGERDGRFGFALCSAGDTDADGFEDLAVGAPYESGGAVYLYQGSQQGLRAKPSQVILASDIPGLPISTLGYSLAGGMDLDTNNHTDLLVGAYESDAIVILRSRPVIDIFTWFGNKTVRINAGKLGCDMDPTSEEVCFQVVFVLLMRCFVCNHFYM